MPLRYIGKRAKDFGLPLWEIVMNLKNFGVGRLVERTGLTRNYPEEPTFYRIIRVEPHTIEYPPGEMRGDLWAEVTFRGRKYPTPENIGNVAFRPDFRLIDKHAEDAFCSRGKARLVPDHILPRTGPLPPLWKELILRQNPGMDPSQIPEIKMVYSLSPNQLIRVAEEGEKPTLSIDTQHTKPIHDRFYKDVIFSREDAVPIFAAKHNAKKINSSPSNTTDSTQEK